MSGQTEKIIGGFRVLLELQAGSGSQGTVYKAVCVEDRHGLVPVGTVVALKVMPVQDGEGVQWRKLQKRTAELARLDHPNVVRYFGCFSEEGMFNDVHVVVQEFLQGETLKESLARKKTGLDVDEGLKVVDATLAGLEYMAKRGIVHRDLKPGNIFLCDDGGVKLIDFEIAKQEGGTVTASVGNIRGSFDYMAPDFTNPEFHGDVQSDVFSMGVVLHEVLSGKTPYERLDGDDKQANFAFLSRWSQTLSSGHSPIHVSSRIKRLLAHADEVLLRALAPKREERFPDFTSFREGLKSIRFRSLKNGDTSYQLLQFIGKGGFGEVFKARERRTGHLVAVKHLMKAAYAERFYREAKIMRKISSSCFVQLVDFFVLETGGGQESFLVMDFLDGMPGSSLRDAIKRRSEAPMEWRDVFLAFARYARGLLAIHQQGIYHRDIKPSNLYYPDGHPELSAIMDLGIARDVNGTATTGQVPGTLDYMPPEVVISDSRGDGGMDIYALGLCFYEALTGKMAFPRLPSGTTAYAAFFERAKSKKNPSFDAPEVRGDEEILSLLQDMTNPDASRRLKNAGILLKRLEAMVDSRFGRDADNEAATIAPTIAMSGEEAATVATSAIGDMDAAAIERERRRMAKAAGKPNRMVVSLAIVTLLLALAGAAVYHFRAAITERFAPADTGRIATPQRPDNSPQSAESPADRARREKEEADSREAQRKIEEQQAALKAQQEIIERQRKELEERQKKLEAERKAEEERRKAEEEIQRIKTENERRAAAEEAKRIAADNAKSEAEKAAEARRLADEKAKRDAEDEKRKAAEMARREKEEADRREARRKIEEQQAALKDQQEAMEKQRIELEERQKKLEAERKAEEERRKAEEERRKIEEERRKATEEARRKKAEEERRTAEKAAQEAVEKAAEEARKKAEAEMAAKMAEMERQLKEAREKAAREAAEREAEAKRLEAERKAADEARKAAEREAEEERKRLAEERKAAEEKAAREKAEREAEAERLEAQRQKVLADQKAAAAEAERIAAEREAAEKTKREAEEKARKLEEEQRKAEEAKKKREDTARDLVSKAGFYYESEDYYEAVKYYRAAVRSGYSMGSGEMGEFEDAYRRANEKIRSLKSRCEDMIRLGQTPLRKLEDLDAESKNLVDWYFEVKNR